MKVSDSSEPRGREELVRVLRIRQYPSELRRSVYTSLLIVGVYANLSNCDDEKKSKVGFEIRVVHQNREDEKNASAFFECGV